MALPLKRSEKWEMGRRWVSFAMCQGKIRTYCYKGLMFSVWGLILATLYERTFLIFNKENALSHDSIWEDLLKKSKIGEKASCVFLYDGTNISGRRAFPGSSEVGTLIHGNGQRKIEKEKSLIDYWYFGLWKILIVGTAVYHGKSGRWWGAGAAELRK